MSDATQTPFAAVMSRRGRMTKSFAWPVLKGESSRQGCFVMLTDEEITAAQTAATEYLRKDLKLDEFQLAVSMERNLYAAEEERQLLARALRDPTEPSMPYATVEDLRRHLDPETRHALMRLYNAFVAERSPITREQDPEKLRALVTDLKEAGGLSDWLICCDSDTLVSIAIALANPSPQPTK